MSDPQNYSAEQSAAPASTTPARPGFLIGMIVMAAFVMILNETTLSNALPDLMVEFSVAADVAQWLTTAFMLTMAVVIPMTGYLMTRMSTRILFIVALSLFVVGSFVATAAPAFWLLLLARVIQAAGTAVIMPMLMTSVTVLVPAKRRGAMMGVVAIVMAVGPAVGPTYAGLILEITSWRWIFGTMIILGTIALIVGGLQMRPLTETSKPPFDVPSAVLSALGFAAAIYGLSNLSEIASGFPTQSVIFLVIGAVILTAFFRRQSSLLKAQDVGENTAPLMNTEPLKAREYTLSLTILLIAFCSLFGFIILMPIFGQQVLDLSALATGLVILPGGVLQGLMAPFIGRIYDAKGTRPLIIPGTALLVSAMVIMALVGIDTSVWYLVFAGIVLNVGMAMIMTPLMSNALGAIPVVLSSHGSSILNTFQQLAGAAGTALFVALMGVGSSHSTATTAEDAPDTLGIVTDGVQVAFWFGAGLACVAFFMSVFLKIDAPLEPRNIKADSASEKA